MHNNYYFLRQLSKELELKLKGTVVSQCFSQSKEELVIRFETTTTPFFVKASLLPNFSCLSFPENFQRARKNSVDLFGELIGCRAQSISQFKNERSFLIQFDNDISLLFKMHGNRSNIIIFKNNEVVELFKNSIGVDEEIKIESLDRAIDWSKENFIASQANLKQTYFTFGKNVWQYLEANAFETKPVNEKWEMFQSLITQLENPSGYYIIDVNGNLALSLLKTEVIIKEHHHPLKAINDFYHTFTQTFAFTKERHVALLNLKVTLEQCESYRDKAYKKLAEVESDHNYKIWADLIMANMHAIRPRVEKITVANFYNNDAPTEIKLKKDLSPQKNAEVFYRKAKNQQIELQRLQQAITGKEKEITSLKEKIKTIESADDLKVLRTSTLALGLDAEKEKQPELLPYHAFEYKGYKIWVGRNAQSNDVLTLKHTYKEDLWLHAKDVAGSHVILKHKAGSKFPKDVIERAAQLAAYNSKRKNETLCPVIVTPKKFVRKRKGDPAGAVVVEREEIIMVQPKITFD